MKNSKWIVLKKINDWFVILESNIVRKLSQTFSHKFIVFLLENVRYVELLEFFVGEIDEELFEWIDCEYLKSENIQQTDTLSIVGWIFVII